MKSFTIQILILSFIILTIAGCGSSLYLNSSYSFNDLGESTIALFPVVYAKNSEAIDTVFEAVFEELFDLHHFISPSTLRSTAQSKEEYNSLLIKLASFDAHKKGIQSFLLTDEFAHLSDFISGSRFFYIPVNFSLKESTPGSAMGKITFRLYDRDGSLILENRKSFNVMPNGMIRSGGLLSTVNIGPDLDPTGSAAAKYCTALLASHGKQILHKYVLINIK